MLLTCQSGFESLLARELAELHGIEVAEKGPGWLRTNGLSCGRGVLTPQSGIESIAPRGEDTPPTTPEHVAGVADPGPASARPATSYPDLAFAHLTLIDPVEIQGESVNSLANQIAEFFLPRLRGERIEASWPNIWLGPNEIVGLGRRVSAVETTCFELLKKKLARVAKLSTGELPRAIGPARGLFVFFTDFKRAFVAREGLVHGPRRMADDALAPSRSYLKIEEAYLLLGREPVTGETVCDLGAAPGGWSYSAAKRGAHVVAVDNGPLKGGALDHPHIEHRREDAFRFAPSAGHPFDWLFCDMVEEPHHVIRNIVAPWFAERWCRCFVINLKFGRVDPIALLRELCDASSPFIHRASSARVRHLFHDREEFTVVGTLA